MREVAHAFNDMADRVAALLRNQRGMTAEVSHQLRTPLSALRLRLELMADDTDDDARVEATAIGFRRQVPGGGCRCRGWWRRGGPR